jgi:endonuclease/exonuclease/phosphatase family metal-dependent hydrolase
VAGSAGDGALALGCAAFWFLQITMWHAFLRLAVTLAAFLALLLAVSLRTSGHWAVELLRYVPFLVWLGPVALLVPLSWRLGWRRRLVAVLALGVVAIDVMHLSLGRDEGGQQPMRLMTFNIKSYVAEDLKLGFEPIVAELDRQAPDVLVMQDAPILEEPDSEMPPPLAVWLKGRHVYSRSQYIVASRWPLKNCAPHDLRAGEQAAEFIVCTVDTPAGPLDLVTTHFISPRDGLNATRHERLRGLEAWRANLAERLGQSRRLADWIAQRDPARRLIVAGDLNAPERSGVVRQLLALGLRDAFSAGGRGWGYTHGHSLRPHITFLRIDHILVNGALGVRASWSGGKEASEHRPVVADFWLSPQR